MGFGTKYRQMLNSKTSLFGLILLLLSIAMAVAIFLKQQSVSPDLDFWKVLIWQFILWIPLVLVLPAMRWVISKYSKPWIWVVFAFLFLGLHYGWFVGMSSLISPYLEYPRTRYGVYPFFFIFWTLIDIFLLIGLIVYLVSQGHKLESGRHSLENTLYVKKGNKGILIKPDEILWIGADDYYSDIHTSKGRFLERKPLKTLLEHLPEEYFIRIHRSTVVNIQAIREFHPISGLKAEVELQDGSKRTVSRTYLKSLKERLAKAKA